MKDGNYCLMPYKNICSNKHWGYFVVSFAQATTAANMCKDNSWNWLLTNETRFQNDWKKPHSI